MVVVAAILYPIPYVSQWVTFGWIHGSGFDYTIVILCGILGIFFLILLLTAIFTSSPDQFLTLKTAMGMIEISKKTIESTAKRSFHDLPDVKNPKVKAKLRRKVSDTSIDVSVEVFDAKALPTLGEEIQALVKNSIESALEVKVSKIKVQIKETKMQPVTKSTKNHQSPRVI